MTIDINSPEFGWVIVVLAITAFHVVITGAPIGSLRRKLFSKEFFAKKFPEIKDPPRNGYPDMGNGFYSQKLTHEDWVAFNNAQRAHYNFIEAAASAVALILGAGLFYPRVAAVLGLVYNVGRLLYSLGYRSLGPKGREIGAFIHNPALVGLFGTALYGAFTHAGGLAGLSKLFA